MIKKLDKIQLIVHIQIIQRYEGGDMKREKNIKSYTAAELKAKTADSRTDLDRIDAQTEAELERLVAEDEDERGIRADWTRAKLVLPQAR